MKAGRAQGDRAFEGPQEHQLTRDLGSKTRAFVGSGGTHSFSFRPHHYFLQHDKGVACNVKEGVHTVPANLHIELNSTVPKIDVKPPLNQAPAPAM